MTGHLQSRQQHNSQLAATITARLLSPKPAHALKAVMLDHRRSPSALRSSSNAAIIGSSPVTKVSQQQVHVRTPTKQTAAFPQSPAAAEATVYALAKSKMAASPAALSMPHANFAVGGQLSPLARSRAASAASLSPRIGRAASITTIPSSTASPAKTHSTAQSSLSAVQHKQTVGCIVSSPGYQRPRSRPTKTYDRFIPDRVLFDKAVSSIAPTKEALDKSKTLDSEALAYQEQLAKACGVALEQRILSFSLEPPQPEKQDFRTTWNRPLRAPNAKVARRRIPTIAEKVLDAPGLLDDFYLNLLDWSSKNLLAIALDQTVYIWNADTGAVQEFCQTAGEDSVASVQWTADGSFLAVGTSQGDAQIWDIDTSSKIRTMRGRNTRVGVLSWDKHILTSGARDGSIWHHDVRIANHKVAELINHTSEVCGLKWRPDGQLLASGGNDNLVNIWDIRSTTPKITKSDHMAAVKAVAWCPWQLNTLATGGGTSDQTVHFWNTTTAGKISSVNTGSQVTSIIWSREYKEFVTSHGFPNNHLSIWSFPSLNKVADLPGHDARVLHTALSPDGQTVASAASDENLKFWKVFESRKGKCATGESIDALSKSLGSSLSIR